MAEARKPELLRYAKTHVAVELPHKFASVRERDQFVDDLVATFEKHGIRAEKGALQTGSGETLGMKIPYGVADFV